MLLCVTRVAVANAVNSCCTGRHSHVAVARRPHTAGADRCPGNLVVYVALHNSVCTDSGASDRCTQRHTFCDTVGTSFIETVVTEF